jgi:hypothetical protein
MLVMTLSASTILRMCVRPEMEDREHNIRMSRATGNITMEAGQH